MSTLKPRKHVYKTDEIPHIWAHGIPSSHGRIRNAQGNLYAEGDTIFSYGSHFPMARRVEIPGAETVFLLTTRDYSVTTRRHLHLVRSAISNLGRVILLDPGTGFGGTSIWDGLAEPERYSRNDAPKWFTRAIEEQVESASRPRIRAKTRETALNSAQELLARWRIVADLFGYDPGDVPAFPEIDALRENYREAIARAETVRAERERAQRERVAKIKAERDKATRAYLPTWRETGDNFYRGADGNVVDVRDLSYPALRLDGAEVLTTLGARVPLEDARALLANLPQLLGGTFSHLSIGPFRGIEARECLKIGCHSIPWDEIRAFCAFYGWEIPNDLPEGV